MINIFRPVPGERQATPRECTPLEITRWLLWTLEQWHDEHPGELPELIGELGAMLSTLEGMLTLWSVAGRSIPEAPEDFARAARLYLEALDMPELGAVPVVAERLAVHYRTQRRIADGVNKRMRLH